MRMVYWLLAATALIVSSFAQTPDGTRKAWNDTLWIDRDGTYQLISDYIDTQNQSTLQFKDTTAMKAASFDSAGVVVNLKQLSSTNTRGGGLFESRPAAEFELDGVTVFASGNASYEFVRLERLRRQPITPEMAGAIGDGSSDDTAALQSAFSVGRSTGAGVDLQVGTYKITSPITIPADNDIGFIVFGRGISRTKILASGCTAFRWATGQHDNVVFKDFEIERSSAGADTGMVVKTTTGSLFQNLKIDNFRAAIHAFTSEDNLFENVSGTADTFGIVLVSNSNGNTISRGGFTADSIAYVTNASHGNVFESLDLGNHPYSIRIENISDAVVIGGQYESHTGAPFWVGGPTSDLDVFGGRSQGNATSVLAVLDNSADINFYDHRQTGFTSDSLIHCTDATSNVRWYGYKNETLFYRYVASLGKKFVLTEYPGVRHFNIASGTAVQYGALVHATGFAGDNYGDALIFGQKVHDLSNASSTIKNYLTDGNDWRVASYTNTTSPDSTPLGSRVERLRMVPFSATATTSAGDSTVIFVYSDTLGIDNFYGVMGTVDRTSPDATPFAAFISQSVTTNSRGRHRLLVWHPWDTGGGISIRVNGLLLVQAKVQGNW